jgi:hypothetical protein
LALFYQRGINTLHFSYRLVDPHSHLGDASSPALDGASGDDNSLKGTIQPWLRSLDGLNTHDDSYSLSIAGGVTTALVLPGSANAIGDLVFLSSRESWLSVEGRWSGLYDKTEENGGTLANLHATRTPPRYQCYSPYERPLTVEANEVGRFFGS